MSSQIVEVNRNTTIKNSRIDELDLLKCFGIIMVVWCHISLPGSSFFSLFHIAIFVIASGMLFNSSKLMSVDGIKKFWKGKFLHLYLPFVLVNLLFLFLNNYFIEVKIYTAEIIPGIMDSPSRLQFVLTPLQTMENTLKVIFLIYDAKMASSTWFVAALLWTEAAFFIFSLIFTRFEFFRKRIWLEIIIEVILSFQLLLLVFLVSNEIISIEIKRFFVFMYLFSLGRGFKFLYDRLNFKNLKAWIKLIAFVVSLLGLFAIKSCGSIGIWSLTIVNPFFFTVASLLGFTMLFSGCSLLCYLPKIIKWPLTYVGQNTMWVLCFHYIFLRIASYIIIKQQGLSMDYMAAHPVIPIGDNIGMGLFYLLFGLAFPLLLSAIYKLLMYFIKKLVAKELQ